MAQTTEDEKRSAPYSSFSTLENFINRLASGGVPAQIDRGFVGGSGANQSQMLATLRYLGLIDGDRRPTPALHELAEKPEARARIYRSLVEDHYRGVLDLGPRATQAMLEQWFRDVGNVTGDTSRKAQSFFVNLAKAGEVEVSAFFKPTRATSKGGRRAPRRAAASTADDAPKKDAVRPASATGGYSHVHPAVLSSLSRIPNSELGQEWTHQDRDLFVQTFGNLLDLFHPAQDDT